MIRSKYRCQKCGFEFERKKPGPVVCKFCGNLYIDWLNWEEVIESLGDYRGHGKVPESG